MAQQRQNKTPNTTNPFPYGYVPVDTAPAPGTTPRPPPNMYYQRLGTPHPNPLQRHLQRPTAPRGTIVDPTPGVVPSNQEDKGKAPAGRDAQPPRPPRQQQQQQRVVLSSQVPMQHYVAGNHAAHIALMASDVRTMVPVAPVAAAAPVAQGPPQQMFKADVEAARALHKLSREAFWEEKKKNGS